MREAENPDPEGELAEHQARLLAGWEGPEPCLPPDSVRTIAGCSQLSPGSGLIISTIECFALAGMDHLGGSWACWRTDFEYESGYLAYREGPAIIKAFDMLPIRPDVLLLPASGIHHPRRMGMARHLGHLLSVPTIGVTRSPLKGSGPIPTYRPAEGRAKVFVSPGWGVDLKSSLEVVAMATVEHRMPEPIYRAKAACRGILAKGASGFM